MTPVNERHDVPTSRASRPYSCRRRCNRHAANRTSPTARLAAPISSGARRAGAVSPLVDFRHVRKSRSSPRPLPTGWPRSLQLGHTRRHVMAADAVVCNETCATHDPDQHCQAIHDTATGFGDFQRDDRRHRPGDHPPRRLAEATSAGCPYRDGSMNCSTGTVAARPRRMRSGMP